MVKGNTMRHGMKGPKAMGKGPKPALENPMGIIKRLGDYINNIFFAY